MLVREFEDKKLRQKFGLDKERFKRSKAMSHWRAAKRVIRDLQIDISEWEDEAPQFYNYFRQHEWSMSYVEKVLSILNKWGHFCARKQRSPFLPIPKPRGQERHEISDSYYDSGKISKESAPLTLRALEKAKSNLNEEHYNWLYVSLQFGLRPSEVDSLKQSEGKAWKVTRENGYEVLNVYQSKLKGVDRSKRWKKIPCLFLEQEKALALIFDGHFKRPLVKTIKYHIEDGLTTYAGRKGFEKYLLDRNIPFEAISSYLGHQSVDRTWRNYRDTGKAVIPPEFKSNDKKSKKKAA